MIHFLGDIEPQRSFEGEIRPLTDAGIGIWFTGRNRSRISSGTE